MHLLTYYLAVIWIAVLLGVTLVRVIRARSIVVRLLALDVMTLILVTLLALVPEEGRIFYYLDAALVLAMLGFVGTLGAARYYAERRLFS